MSDLDLGDIQGIVLRGYSFPYQRHLLLGVADAPHARAALGLLIDGTSGAAQVGSAVPWTVKPPFVLSLGVTASGLRALGASGESLASFPAEFTRGAGDAAAAARVGYTGESEPDGWIDALAWRAGSPSKLDVLLILAAESTDARDSASEALLSKLVAPGAFHLLTMLDGAELPESRVHFGYVDGISQPRIAGGPPPKIPDDLPLAPPGEFLLGYESSFPGFTYPVPSPQSLGRNGTFASYGVLKQNVEAFDAFLHRAALETGADPEWIAAKMCGRWRSGLPLSLSPLTDTPVPEIPPEQWNRFDYVPTAAHPDSFDDSRGARCPLGSHIRRCRPRSGKVAGSSGELHRLIRRGIPYGPPYDANSPPDGIERGLLGLFLCVSLKDQFEFIMAEWVNGDAFGLLGDRDPLSGDNDGGPRRFRIPRPNGKPLVLQNLTRFITVRGSAYLFLPSLTAIRYLAGL